jgi:hypothetical protein
VARRSFALRTRSAHGRASHIRRPATHANCTGKRTRAVLVGSAVVYAQGVSVLFQLPVSSLLPHDALARQSWTYGQ